MRPASARSTMGQRKSRLEIKVGTRGLCRRTEPRDADTQMQGFLTNGTVPVLSFKACPQKVQASLFRPLQVVRTDLMSLATAILDRVAGQWGCVEGLVEETRGEKISRRQAVDFIEDYLVNHNVPGKLQVHWVEKLNSGGKLQEYGRRNKPMARRLTLWISSSFAGVQFSRSMTAFADHEICTHAVRAINDHAQVWVNHRGRYGLCSKARERLSTEEGLAALNSLICYPSQTRYLWSAAMLYYCAVKGKEMGFGELHKHLMKYVRCPAKRYWYCIRTKGKRVDLHQPGSCGKGQVYLEGAVDVLRAVNGIDFHLLYSGRVPLSKLDRVKNIVRSSLVTLPRFVQDQAKYKAILRQIGRLNGILSEDPHPSAGPKQTVFRRAKSLPPRKIRTRAVASIGKEAAANRRRKQVPAGLPKHQEQYPSNPERSSPPPQAACDGLRDKCIICPSISLSAAPSSDVASLGKRGGGYEKSTPCVVKCSCRHTPSGDGATNDRHAPAGLLRDAGGIAAGCDENTSKQALGYSVEQLGAQVGRGTHNRVGWRRDCITEPIKPALSLCPPRGIAAVCT